MTVAEVPGGTHPAACSKGCPRHRAMKPLVSAVLWLIAAAGAMAVSAVPLELGEGMCGVWGCFPPLQALLAMHLLWAVALGAAVHALRGWSPRLLRRVGGLLFAVALAAAVWVAGADLALWLDRVPDGFHAHWPKRVGYTLATHIDLPLVEGAVAGLVAVALAGRRSNRQQPSGVSP